MVDAKKSRGLGRGLSALMADVDLGPAASDEHAGQSNRTETLIPIDRIEPNPNQPRRSFPPESLEELASSIAAKGIIQPLIVRPDPENPKRFQIVAGERRWRAAQMAQLHEVPAIVRELDDTETLEVAIVENIQRSDLNPVDEAAGYRQLMDRFGHTQEQMATALGKSRSHIANSLRLLNLPGDVQLLLVDGRLSSGHARALVTSDRASEIARQIVAKNLSVRQTEALMRSPDRPAKVRGPGKDRPEKDADTRALQSDLSAHLGMSVSIDPSGGGREDGTVTLTYRDFDQLDRLCRLLSGEP